MDIDITDLTAFEIQNILTSYPRGKLVIKYDRIFWDSGNLEPMTRPMAAAPMHNPQQPPRQPNQGNDIGKRFERMADTLGGMVC